MRLEVVQAGWTVDSSVVEHLSYDAGVLGSIQVSAIYFHSSYPYYTIHVFVLYSRKNDGKSNEFSCA